MHQLAPSEEREQKDVAVVNNITTQRRSVRRQAFGHIGHNTRRFVRFWGPHNRKPLRMIRGAHDILTLFRACGRCGAQSFPGGFLQKHNVEHIFITFEEYIRVSKATVHVLTKYSNHAWTVRVGCPVHPERLLVGMEAERAWALTSE